jgi:hypothetical protein
MPRGVCAAGAARARRVRLRLQGKGEAHVTTRVVREAACPWRKQESRGSWLGPRPLERLGVLPSGSAKQPATSDGGAAADRSRRKRASSLLNHAWTRRKPSSAAPAPGIAGARGATSPRRSLPFSARWAVAGECCGRIDDDVAWRNESAVKWPRPTRSRRVRSTAEGMLARLHFLERRI